MATADEATVAGGGSNTASGTNAAVGGGRGNVASGLSSMVAGGQDSVASGEWAIVAGGFENAAEADYSFAAGRKAKIDPTHDGAFLWSDSRAESVNSPGRDTFSVRARGGIWFGWENTPETPMGRFINTSTGGYLTNTGIWTNSSDRNNKTELTPVDSREVLTKVADLPMTTWRYHNQPEDQRHMGPMAQDFHRLFGLGAGDTSISTVDTAGVSLAAIQGLYEMVEEQRAEISQLNDRLRELEDIVNALAAPQGDNQ
ncbi:MAG: tail fiber domain-containing protein [Planctomycetota bacterium]